MTLSEQIEKAKADVRNAEFRLQMAREELEKAQNMGQWRHDTPDSHRWLIMKDGNVGIVPAFSRDHILYPVCAFYDSNGIGWDDLETVKRGDGK